MVDANSASSYRQIDRERKIKRILRPFEENPDSLFADFEVMKYIGANDMNDVQPPITWALTEGRLLKSGMRRVNPHSGKECRCCKLNKDGQDQKTQEQIKLWEQG
jgi:hypothetical protein